jgi:methionine-rich copper-binding protein CopC
VVYLRLKFVTLCLLLLLGAFVLAGNPLAQAHGEIERSDPAADTVIPAAPAEVHIWFSQELFRREGGNVIEVSGPEGNRVDGGDTRIDDDDRKHAFVSLQPELPPGLYTVSWRNLSVEDGHGGSGEFSFTVESVAGEAAPQSNPPPAQQAATETPAALPSPTPASPATPTPEPAPTPTPPATGGLPCLNGLLLGGLFLAVTLSGQGREGRG